MNQKWYFTFPDTSKYRDYYCVFKGTKLEAKYLMNSYFGLRWAFQYDEEEWNEQGIPQNIKYGYKLVTDYMLKQIKEQLNY